MSKLKSLLGSYALTESVEIRKQDVGVSANAQALVVELDQIEPDPNQPRTELPEEEKLAGIVASMKRFGVLQPIAVRWDATSLSLSPAKDKITGKGPAGFRPVGHNRVPAEVP